MITDDDAPTDEAIPSSGEAIPSSGDAIPSSDDATPISEEPSPSTEQPLGITGELEAASNVTLAGYVPAAPAVTGLRPNRADRRGGTQITILGAGFAPGCRVFVDGEELIGEVIDGFTLRFVAPACDADKALVEVEAA